MQMKVEEEHVPVLEVSKVREAMPNGQAILAYLIQTPPPRKRPERDIWRITLTATDPETGETGESLLFWENRRYR
jgi:hypothetical protein